MTYKSYENDLRLNPDADAVLDSLSRKGIRQYILSAAMQDDLVKMLDHFNTDRFDGISGTGKTGAGKQLMQDYSLNPQRTLLIGDTLHDAEIGNYILYSGGHNSYELLVEKAPVMISLKEIIF